MARWEAVVAAGVITFTLVVGNANTAEAACGGPGGTYPPMTSLASNRATDEVIPGKMQTRGLDPLEIDAPAGKATPKAKAVPAPGPKLKIVRVAGVRGSFNVERTYNARCPNSTTTTDVSFKISVTDLQTAFAQKADYVIIDFGGGAGANCPAFADDKQPPHFTPRAAAGSDIAVVWNNGAAESGRDGNPKDNVSFVRLGDAEAIGRAGCFAIALRR